MQAHPLGTTSLINGNGDMCAFFRVMQTWNRGLAVHVRVTARSGGFDVATWSPSNGWQQVAWFAPKDAKNPKDAAEKAVHFITG